jgi:hypothetical protein
MQRFEYRPQVEAEAAREAGEPNALQIMLAGDLTEQLIAR